MEDIKNVESIYDNAEMAAKPEDVKNLQAAINAHRAEESVIQGNMIDPALLARFRKTRPFKRVGDKVRRNDPCPCGSGKKFKNCCIDKKEFNQIYENGVKPEN